MRGAIPTDGAAAFAIHNGELTARVYATGMAPNQLHPQHIHGLPNFENSTCPAPGAANRIPGLPGNVQNPDRLIAFEEGLPDYGEIRVPLDGQLDATAQPTTFPTANAQGVVNYLQKTSFADLQSALGDFQLLPLEEKAVVLHGGFVTGADGEQVYVASLPVACAQIRMTEETELRQRRQNALVVPEGFRAEKVVDGLSFTTEMTFDDRGRLYVAAAGGARHGYPMHSRLFSVVGCSRRQRPTCSIRALPTTRAHAASISALARIRSPWREIPRPQSRARCPYAN